MSKLARLLFPAAVLLLLTLSSALAHADVHVRSNVYWGWGGAWTQDGYGYHPPAVGNYDGYGRRVYVQQYASPPPQQGCCSGCCCQAQQTQCQPPPQPAPEPYYAPQPQPQQPQGWYAPAPAPAPYPEAVVYTPEEPPLRTIGVGIRASSTTLETGADGTLEGGGGGLLLRLRGERMAVELELGGDEYPEIGRSDGRFGATLYLHLTKDSALVPYALVGLGLNTVHYAGMSDEDYWTQGYAEAGGGVGLNLGTRVFVSGDLRMSARSLADEQEHVDYDYAATRALPPAGYGSYARPDDETGFEFRLAAHLFF